MPHRRTRIRDAAAVLLETIPGLTVTKSRIHNWQSVDFPGVAIYTLREPTDMVTIAREQERRLRLVLEIHVETTGDVDTDVDDNCVLVEKAIDSDYQFGGLAINSGLEDTTIGLTGEGDQRHGVARLEYEVVYRTDPAAPDG